MQIASVLAALLPLKGMIRHEHSGDSLMVSDGAPYVAFLQKHVGTIGHFLCWIAWPLHLRGGHDGFVS